jgi:hypothetical protein
MVSSLHKALRRHHSDWQYEGDNPPFSSIRGTSDYKYKLKDTLTGLRQFHLQLTENPLLADIDASMLLMGPLNTTTVRNSEPVSSTSHPNGLYS